MPIKKKTANLSDLCIQNVAENFIYHCRTFKNSVDNEELQYLYCFVQHIFGELLLNKLFAIHRTCQDNPESECFCKYLLFESEDQYADEWRKKNSSLDMEFILPENARRISISCENYSKLKISTEVTSHIFAKCKAMRSLDLHRSCINEAHFLKAVSGWNNIAKLNLSQTNCTNLMVIVIWEKLPYLQWLYLSFCQKITDVCLMHLCRCPSLNRRHMFCRENGVCSNIGKKLKVLDIDGTAITRVGIACALLHLQSLEDLIESGRQFYPQSYVPSVILSLIDVHQKTRREFSPLNLKCLDCEEVRLPPELREILSVSPHLEKLAILASPDNLRVLARNFIVSIRSLYLIFPSSEVIDSIVFQGFLMKRGEHFEKLVVSINWGDLSMRHLVEILTKCKNLKEFRIVGFTVVENIEKYFVPEFYAPFENLRVLHLNGVGRIELQHQAFFIRVLNQMINLRTLEVSSFVAENVLSRALEMNDFRSLEKIVINYSDMRNVSFEQFVGSDNSLKEIILSSCTYEGDFLEKHREVARKNNFYLEIKHQEAVFSGLEYSHELAERTSCCRP